jgi:hypothetical protein
MSNLEYFFCLSKEGSVLQFYFACSRKSLKGLRASRFYRGVIRFVYCFYSLGRIAIPVIELRYVSQYLRPREEFELEVVNCSFVKRDTTLILRLGYHSFTGLRSKRLETDCCSLRFNHFSLSLALHRLCKACHQSCVLTQA